MSKAATLRTRQPRANARPTTDAEPTRWEGRPGFYAEREALAAQPFDWAAFRARLRRGAPVRGQAAPGERALRKRLIRLRRLEAKARASANGRRG